MTKSMPKRRDKNQHMTEKDIKYGCLSKSLEDFLLLNPGDREKKYGKGKAKYYQRIIQEVDDSFRDVVLAYHRLPPEYSNKINLRLGLDLIRKEIMRQKSAKDQANFSISQASQSLGFVLNELAYPDVMTKLFRSDFNKVQDWLVILEHFPVELKKMPN